MATSFVSPAQLMLDGIARGMTREECDEVTQKFGSGGLLVVVDALKSGMPWPVVNDLTQRYGTPVLNLLGVLRRHHAALAGDSLPGILPTGPNARFFNDPSTDFVRTLLPSILVGYRQAIVSVWAPTIGQAVYDELLALLAGGRTAEAR